MFINIEIKTSSAETIQQIANATSTEPIQHQTLNCGYNNVSIGYQCSKNDYAKIKKHWKDHIPDCIVVAM